MRTVYEYQSYLYCLVDASHLVRRPFRLEIKPVGKKHRQASLTSATPTTGPETHRWRLVNGATLFAFEEVLIADDEIVRPVYRYAYEQFVPQPDGSDVRFFFRFELENLPPTPQKPQPHLHVAGTHPNAHKIHFPSPPITLADVLTLIHHHLF
ncbi:MAG: hypothetical protein ISS49_06965 [Anaerolineae bacterium]|nr:hypothetical protein [Anaerolineae bacterium]